jgi:hypothetical protein
LLDEKANKTVRTVARNLMNELAEIGPVWSGDFRDSYVARDVSSGQFRQAKYPYKLGDIPELPLTKKELKRVKRIVIENTAPHAKIAMDLVSGDFTLPKGKLSPEGDVVARGSRPEGGRRGEIGRREVGQTGDNRSTAPLDWYTTFEKGGKLEKIMQKTINTTFIGEL